MNATLLRYEGDRDGIRFGEILFHERRPLRRSFHLDRLNWSLSLYAITKNQAPRPDRTPERIEASLRACDAYEPRSAAA